MTPDIQALIAEAKRLDSAADSGPWATKITGSGESQYCDIVQADDTCAIVCVMSDSYRELDNAEFIAHARTALPALVAEVERLRRCLDQAVDATKVLYTALDDIDTFDDMYKDDTAYREAVRQRHVRRFDIAVTDGYKLEFQDHRPDLYAELKAREGR